MKQTDYTTRVLTAEPGHLLTQAAEVPDTARTLTETVYLAVSDSPDSWREITADEANALRARIDAAQAPALPAESSADAPAASDGSTATTDEPD